MISRWVVFSREVPLTIWLNVFSKKKRRKRICDNLEIIIAMAASMGFLFSFYLFYIYSVISESQIYMVRGLAVIVLLASAITGSHFT